MIRRDEFKTVVKIFSIWRVDKRRGNYRLPSGRMRLNVYLDELVADLLKNNSLGFGSNGNVYDLVQSSDGMTMIIPFDENEPFRKSEQAVRVWKFVEELID